MPRSLFIDPGPSHSAYVVWDGSLLTHFGKVPNVSEFRTDKDGDETMLDVIAQHSPHLWALVLEQIQSYGQVVSTSVFETVRWSGRFEERWLLTGGNMVVYIPRKDVKLHFLGSSSVKGADSQIAAELQSRFGSKGTKKNRGFFYGFKDDIWQAMALGVYFTDAMQQPFPRDQSLLQLQPLYQAG